MTPTISVTCGIDLVDLHEFRASMEHGGENFLSKCFVREELDECEGNADSLAARFAAKEAVTKALGTGIRGLTLDQIVVTRNRVGKPQVQLRGDALRLSQDQGWASCDVSITHSAHTACAVVVALRNGECGT